MTLLDIPSDILISLFTDWFDRYSVLTLDSALTNRKERPKFLSVLELKECCFYFKLDNHDKEKFLEWAEARSAYLECLQITSPIYSYSESAYLNSRANYITLFKLSICNDHIGPLCGFAGHLQEIEFHGTVGLTDELIVAIFTNLPNKERMTDVYISDNDTLTNASLLCIVSCCSKLKILTIYRTEQLLISDDDFTCPELKHVESFCETNNKSTTTMLTVLLKGVKGLKVLQCDAPNIFDIVEPQVNLTDLRVYNIKDSDAMVNFVKQSPSITKLYMTRCDLGKEGYKKLSQVSTSVTDIRVWNDVEHVLDLISGMKKLTSISIEGTISSDDEVWDKLKSYGANLTSVEVSSVYGRFHKVSDFSKACTNLKVLSYDHCYEEYNFHTLWNLEEICFQDSDLTILSQLVIGCPKLERIAVAGNAFDNADTLFDEIKKNGHSMRSISLTAGSSMRISNQGLLQLCGHVTLRQLTITNLVDVNKVDNIDNAVCSLKATNRRLFVQV